MRTGFQLMARDIDDYGPDLVSEYEPRQQYNPGVNMGHNNKAKVTREEAREKSKAAKKARKANRG